VYDEEIAYALAQASGGIAAVSGNYLAAAYCADALAAKYSRRIDKSVGDLRLSYGQLAKQFQSLGAKLRMRATLKAVVPYVGGTSAAEKLAARQDADRVGTAAKVDGMNYAAPLNPLVTGSGTGA
jgi:hypothetical protein